jgi:DNA-binding PadR family transcriptional regulator
MTYEHTASDLPPFLARLAMMKGGGPRGRHFEDFERLAALRNLRGGGFGGGGPFGAAGGGPFGGGGRGRRRRGEIRVALLRLIAEEPRNGYQLMQTIEERSGGRWRPSPGSVYPTLAQLEDEGLIRSAERDGAKLFEITPQGTELIEKQGDGPAPWEIDEDDPAANAMAEIGSLVFQIGKAAIQVVHEGDEEQTKQAAQTLGETRRALYRILAQDPDA